MAQQKTNEPEVVLSIREQIIDSFSLLWKGQREMLGIFIPFFLEGIVYFGTLTVLVLYLSKNVGLSDLTASWIVALATAGITITQFGLGETADRKGYRWGILFAFSMMVVGRIFLGFGGALHLGPGLWGGLFFATIIGLGFIAVGYGTYHPAAYAAIKKLTSSPKDLAMAAALLYGLQNLGSFAAGKISPYVRHRSEQLLPPNGISGVLIVYALITIISFLITKYVLKTKPVLKKNSPKQKAVDSPKINWGRFKEWLFNHPLANRRFCFFIFILIPVQTLFAHNWLTIPTYISRAFVKEVADNFEFYANLNPIIIFVAAPLVAAFTRNVPVYTMMIVGTATMACPTIMLSIWEPNATIFILYILIESVGEAMWQPRFLQYVVEIAPAGKEGMYMGVAQFPWFLTKLITGGYAGWFLAHYCPPDKALQNTQFMWGVYTAIACVSPIVLLVARKWASAGITDRTHVPNTTIPPQPLQVTD